MDTFHQCGHNSVWNLDSIEHDGAGAGLIISPVNMEAGGLQDKIPEAVRNESWLDPQFYLPGDSKGQLVTYPYFPANVVEQFNTGEYSEHALEVAERCLQFQHDLGLRYVTIPTRYFGNTPADHLVELSDLFVEPFLEAYSKLGFGSPLLLTVIAKEHQIAPGDERDELLSWITGFQGIGAVYLIFENSEASKQIKDPGFLANGLRFIHILRQNDMDVHIGYSGLEGLLYSVADASSVSMGSYENLRSFGIDRLTSKEAQPRNPPKPRVYSGKLLQWMEDTYLPPIRQLVGDWSEHFDDSPYKEYLLDPESRLNFQRSEIYKHYFYLFSQQAASLPVLDERINFLRNHVEGAMARFDAIRASGVFLDSESDGSHLPAWMNAMAMFEAQPE